MKAIFFSLLAVIILASSCSQKFSLQKRRYNKGFYFAGSGKSHQKEARTNNEDKHPAESDKAEIEIVRAVAPNNSIEAAEQQAAVKATKKQIQLIEKSLSAAQKQSNENKEQSLSKNSPALNKPVAKSQIRHHTDGLYVGVAIGGILGFVIALIWLLTMYTIGQALLIILVVLLISALLGGGAYVSMGF